MSEVAAHDSDPLGDTQQSYQHSVADKSSIYVAGVSGAAEGEEDALEDDPFSGSLRSQSVEPQELQPSNPPSIIARTESMRSGKSVTKTASVMSRRSAASSRGVAPPQVFESTGTAAVRTPDPEPEEKEQEPTPEPVSIPDELEAPPPSSANPFQVPGRETPAMSETTSYAAELSIAASRNTKLGYNSNTVSNLGSGSGVQARVSSEIDVVPAPPPIEKEEEEEEEEIEDDTGEDSPPPAVCVTDFDHLAASCVAGPLFSPYEPPEQQDQDDLGETAMYRTQRSYGSIPPPATAAATTAARPSVVRRPSSKKKVKREAPPSPVVSPPNYESAYVQSPTQPRDFIREVACDIWDQAARQLAVEKARGKGIKTKKAEEMAKRKQAKDDVIQLRAEERATQFHAKEKYPGRRFNVNTGAKGSDLDRNVGSLWLTESAMNYEETFGVQPISSPSGVSSPPVPVGSPQRDSKRTGKSVSGGSPLHGMRTIRATRTTLDKTRLTPDSENSVDAVARLRKLQTLSSASSLLRCPKPSAIVRPSSTANPHHPEWRVNPDGTMLLPNGMLYNLADHPSLRRGLYS